MITITMRDGAKVAILPVGSVPTVVRCPVCDGVPCVSPKYCPGSK